VRPKRQEAGLQVQEPGVVPARAWKAQGSGTRPAHRRVRRARPTLQSGAHPRAYGAVGHAPWCKRVPSGTRRPGLKPSRLHARGATLADTTIIPAFCSADALSGHTRSPYPGRALLSTVPAHVHGGAVPRQRPSMHERRAGAPKQPCAVCALVLAPPPGAGQGAARVWQSTSLAGQPTHRLRRAPYPCPTRLRLRHVAALSWHPIWVPHTLRASAGSSAIAAASAPCEPNAWRSSPALHKRRAAAAVAHFSVRACRRHTTQRAQTACAAVGARQTSSSPPPPPATPTPHHKDNP
jgi:hypothetical protein